MTRRVRFTPLVRAGAFAAASWVVRAHAVEVPFVQQATIANGVDVRGVETADLDGDGDVDLVDNGQTGVHWYERVGSAWIQRTIHTLATNLFSVGLAVADLDRDGDLDVLSSSFQAGAIYWHDNAAGDASVWTLRTLSATAANARAVDAADMDGDGDLDVVAGFQDRTVWFENPGGLPPWTMRTISTVVNGPDAVVPADVDGDGDTDIVFGGYESFPAPHSAVRWARNTTGAGTTWTMHTIAIEGYGTGVTVSAIDVNGDGDMDVVAGYANGRVTYFENSSGSGFAWIPRTIPGIVGGPVVTTGDLDGDGDPDILAGFRGTSNDHTFWFENTAGNGTAWTKRTVATSAEHGPSAMTAADLDRDGDRDFLLGTSVADRLVWFRNDSIHRSACFAPAAAVSTNSLDVRSVATADVDGDGAMDVVAAATEFNAVRWHANVLGDGSSWLPRLVATNGAVSAAPADVDGDGDVDIFASLEALSWHENVGGAGLSWTARTISTLVTGALALSGADVDGDGDTDAVSAGYASGLRSFANAAGNGTAWNAGTIAAGSFMAGTIADVDGDGDLDAASSTSLVDPRVSWHDNAAGNGSAWTPHTVASLSTGASNGIGSADVDRDGDVDLVVSFRGPTTEGLRWFSNLDGAGTSWSTATISNDLALSLALGDLDQDGDLDALSTGFADLAVRWHENDGGGWTQRTLATAQAQCYGIAAGDLDRDGDLDVVVGKQDSSRIDWFANRGGQFALAAVDIAPPGAPNGELVAMLRVVAAHRGRLGDGSVELASLGLRFEEDAGDRLTTAEANALIESLRVYLDSNGTGVFEPAGDLLVANLPTLALASGVQSVPFADGDVKVQLDFGTARTYFVVAELTADANSQSPNRFRVTLLGQGPSASTAEDRTHDLALAPACPADVASTVMGATPVTLQRFSVE